MCHEIEKVLKGLECCLPLTTQHGVGKCDICPYNRKISLEGGICECMHDLQTDVLVMLKAYDKFSRWLVRRVMDDAELPYEEQMENAFTNMEIICRKLVELGYLRIDGNFYVTTGLAEDEDVGND